MSKRIASFALSGFLIIVLLNWSCTKIDTTTIGSDLLPPVDNVNTFADTFAINTTQGVFYDTTKLTVSNTAENYVFGKTDDPVLGATNARLFLQLKPGFYPYYMGNANDTIVTADSVVLCFAYKAAYGDTNSTMTFQVNAVAPSSGPTDPWDSLGTTDKPSLRDINYAPQIGADLSGGPVTIDFHSLSSYKVIGKGKDSVINQVRIKLSPAFRDALFNQDSAYSNIFNDNGFARDTFFRAFNNGFAITMTQGNALLYTQLSDPFTRLEMHYTFKHGVADTGMSVFTFNNGSGGTSAPRRSSVADNIARTRNPLPNPGDQEIYLQTAPGTYASLKIPQLTGYTNRIIHRAEITLEQIPTPGLSDSYFKAPDYLYVDLVDSGTSKWKPIYNDLNPSYPYDPDYKSGLPYFPGNNQVDYSYFGAVPKQKSDPSSPSGERTYYTINISRYVQQIVTKQTPNYELRLFAPYNLIYPQYSDVTIPYPNLIAAGRVRIGGGNAIDPKYRMRLRIIYSNIK